MLEMLMERLKKLEHDLNERQVLNRMRKQYHQQRQKKKKKHREVICHKCKQPEHFASGCANAPPHVLPSMHQIEEVLILTSQVCDNSCASPDNDIYTIAINSVSNYTCAHACSVIRCHSW